MCKTFQLTGRSLLIIIIIRAFKESITVSASILLELPHAEIWLVLFRGSKTVAVPLEE
jgi:hypothetical protein